MKCKFVVMLVIVALLASMFTSAMAVGLSVSYEDGVLRWNGSDLDGIYDVYVDGSYRDSITAKHPNGQWTKEFAVGTHTVEIKGANGSAKDTFVVEPEATATPDPTVEPTAEPTADPTVEPTAEPTADPTVEPTAEPTADPTVEPTAEPTADPTVEPTAEPTADPTVEPTAEPTADPTVEPTAEPTADPTVEPTAEPTAKPTVKPTVKPTAKPDDADDEVPKTGDSNMGMYVVLGLMAIAAGYLFTNRKVHSH